MTNTTYFNTSVSNFKGTEVSMVNLTPHAITLNDGRVFQNEAELGIARVNVEFTHNGGHSYTQTFGSVENLPEETKGVIYIVSAMVLSALAGTRPDVVAPATGHPDTIRNDKGHVVSVPGFVS